VNRVVVASNNPGKIRELTELLKPLGIEAVAQSTFAIAEAEEPHDTFLENALAKARHAANLAGLPACAIPMGRGRDGLPISLQITGPRGADGAVLAAAEHIEELLHVARYV
jgi:Asp-tRNA(Asn)/Glu-tRNA(Gln) amidotransferase A subunit family amidase